MDAENVRTLLLQNKTNLRRSTTTKKKHTHTHTIAARNYYNIILSLKRTQH